MRQRMIVKDRVEGAIRCENHMRSHIPWHIPNYHDSMVANHELSICIRCQHPIELRQLDDPEDGKMWRTTTALIREWP